MSRRSSRRLLIIYHRPGVVHEHARIARFAEKLRSHGIEARSLTIEEALHEAPEKEAATLLLLFTRGGHWASLVEKGYPAEPIPVHLTAAAIALEARRRGHQRVTLVALRAHRLREQQLQDLEELAALLRGIHGLEATVTVLERLAAPPEAQGPLEGAVAPLALLQGRLVRAACSLAEKGNCLGPFMDYGEPLLAAWAIDRATGRRPCRPREMDI